MTLNYLTIQTMDPEKMKDFYSTYLGAAVLSAFPFTDHGCGWNAEEADSSSAYVLSFDGGFKIKLYPCHGDSQSSLFRPSLSVLSFKVGSRRRVNELTCRLIMDGYEVMEEPGPSGHSHYSSRVFDPERNVIELVA